MSNIDYIMIMIIIVLVLYIISLYVKVSDAKDCKRLYKSEVLYHIDKRKREKEQHLEEKNKLNKDIEFWQLQNADVKNTIEIMRKSYDRKEEELRKSINDNADLFIENRKLKRIVYAYEQEHKIIKEQNEEMANNIKELINND